MDEVLGQPAMQNEQIARMHVAVALGRIGDWRTVESLLAILTDEVGTKGSRAFAVIALELVADRDELPRSTILMVDLSCPAAPHPLRHRGLRRPEHPLSLDV